VQSGTEQQVAPNKMKNVTKQQIAGAIKELSCSIMTVAHSRSTLPVAGSLAIPNNGFQQAPEQSSSFSIKLKN